MITLSIDTATKFLVLGLRNTVYLERSVLLGRRHAEEIADGVARLWQNPSEISQVQRIVVGVGPGSYTGIRIGISYALGLSRALGAELCGVSTLEAMAVSQEGWVAPMLDARGGQQYGGLYRIQDGILVETALPGAKYESTVFEETLRAYGATAVTDCPSGSALIRRAEMGGAVDPKPRYL